jgi:predicted ATPase
VADYPRGTVAFLFTDIEESARRWEQHARPMAAAVERHFAILRSATAGHHGVLFKTVGDAAQAAFPTVPDAVGAAIAAQIAFREEDWGGLGSLRVRMAIHAGDATPQDGDYLAPSLNRLARLLGAGHGEQILLTHAARTLATPLPAGYTLLDLGKHRLRDLLDAEPIFQVTGPNLPDTFPPLQSLDRHPNNLPAQPTALVGREDDLVRLHAMLTDSGTRLVTLIGPGGTGKSRLALQVAADVLGAFPDGVWWVPLAPVADPTLVPHAIATVLGVREAPGVELSQILANHLAGRRTLLVLDNVEHLLPAARGVDDLLRAAPGLAVLATSREPLRLRAEREVPVPPLPLPPDRARLAPEEALAFPAVRLLVERAAAVKPGFALDPRNVADVVAVCRRLDGLPLAIELAAARVRLLPPAALLARLDRRLALLTGGARDLPERQQTLRAAIAWSHDLLDPAERALFARLAVFAGSFALDAAETVCGAAGGLPLDLLDGIDSLTQKSLLRQEDGPTGEPRFAMLQTIAEFARERLAELPEGEELHRVHARFFLALAEEADWDDVSGQANLLDRLEADHANLRQAIGFYEREGPEGLPERLRLVAALAHFWWVRGYFAEGRRALDAALAAGGESPTVDCVAALSGAALLAEAQGDLARAEQLYEEALALQREAADTAGIAQALSGLGVIARQRGDLKTAETRYGEALAAWRDNGDAPGIAVALLDLGLVRLLAGDYDQARRTLEESLTAFRSLRYEAGIANVLQSLGLIAMDTGDIASAISQFGESLERWRALGDRRMTAIVLANLGEAHHLDGALDTAEPLYREALALSEALGFAVGRGFVLNQLGLLALDRGDPTAARKLLTESLGVRWDTGERGPAADTLEALAEADWRLGDAVSADRLLQLAAAVRAETGAVRQAVYHARFERVRSALGSPGAAVPSGDIESLTAAILRRSPHTLVAGVRT